MQGSLQRQTIPAAMYWGTSTISYSPRFPGRTVGPQVRGALPGRPRGTLGYPAGEIVTGRPAGPGCPVYHALRVLSANPVTGVLECHTVGPLAARQATGKVHDVQAYHVHAFEGLAEVIAGHRCSGAASGSCRVLHDGPVAYRRREHGAEEEGGPPCQARGYQDTVR